MKTRRPSPLRRLATCLAACLALAASSSSCRKAQQGGAANPAADRFTPRLPAELLTNNLGRYPGGVTRYLAKSPIRWQPWTAESLALAKETNRMVFAVIAMPQQPVFQSVLKVIEEDPALVSIIHTHYVPILIDGDASREMGLLTADLCAEINRPLLLPLFLWITPEADPVAWIPVGTTRKEGVADLFNQSHTMVSRIWQDDPDYVMRNSRLDNINRFARIAARRNAKIASFEPAEDSLRAVRQLTAFYDPISRTFDEAGGLFPSGAIDLLASAARHPALPEDIRRRSLETVENLMQDLLPSAMFDPLDGGLFSSRRGTLWALPSFQRDSVTQARAIVSLLRAHRATGQQLALDRALNLLQFTEKTYATRDGLFSIGLQPAQDPADWLWSVEDIERILPAEDRSWWIDATGMRGLGNLPPESDPRREFFRANSISLPDVPDRALQALNISPQRFETARKSMLKERETRLGTHPRDEVAHAGASLRMVSAYAAAFTATGDDEYRKKAVNLLALCRQTFTQDTRLRAFSQEAPASIGEARAFLYALAIQCVLDVADITLDDNLLAWSDDLATTMTELFTVSDFLNETSAEARLLDLPVTDLIMLFDDSTGGLVSFAECRLASLGRPLIPRLSNLATPLPTAAVDRPILHTDLIQSTLSRHYPFRILVGEAAPAELRREVERMPLRMVHRRMAAPADDVPPNSIRIHIHNQEPVTISSLEELRQVSLP